MPSKSFVFYNNKGGVGKTTLAFNFSAEIALRCPEKNILLVDLDSQCNSSSLCLGGGQRGQKRVVAKQQASKGVKTFFVDRKRHKVNLDSFVLNARDERRRTWEEDCPGHDLDAHIPANLNFVCGSADLDLYASALEKSAQRGSDEDYPTPFFDTYNILRGPLKELDDTWIVIIDTNPSFSIITRIALVAAEELIIPTSLDEFSGGGAATLLLQLSSPPAPQEGPDGARRFQFTSLRKLIENGQNSERTNQYCPPNYELLDLAKIRTIVVNRLPFQPSRAIQNVQKSFYSLIAQEYLQRPESFAPPHLPPGVELDEAKDIEDAEQIVNTYYFHQVTDLQGTMSISHNLGIPVTCMNTRTYNMIFDYMLEDESKTPRIGVDAVRFGLEIQDLVELALQSSWTDECSINGVVKGGKSEYKWDMVAPCVHDPSNDDPRRGRRVLALERCSGMPKFEVRNDDPATPDREDEEKMQPGSHNKRRKKK